MEAKQSPQKFVVPIGPQHPALKEPGHFEFTVEGEVITGATVRLGRNSNSYRLGNRYQSSISIARELSNWMSLSAGVRGELWENISGSDTLLDPTDEPTKDPNLQGGKRLSALFGITFHPQKAPLKGQHFHVLGEVPVVESLDGPQLQRSWVIRLGWQLEF